MCAVCAVVHVTRPRQDSARTTPATDPWEAHCGARFVDDLWSGYARTAVRARRERDRDECAYEARDAAMEEAERAARAELGNALAQRYPGGQVDPKTMPLVAAEADAVREFWRDVSQQQALRHFSLDELAYPDVHDSENEWLAEVVARDMMRDLQALQVARQRARAVADVTRCSVRPETRADVEAAFDSMMWRLFTAGDPCARMYIGFGNEEVRRLLARVHG